MRTLRSRVHAVLAAALLFVPMLAVSFASPTPAFAAALVVNATGDGVDATPGDGACDVSGLPGTCTLRAAIQEANALAGSDLIAFSIQGGNTTIAPTSPLPPITEAVFIDGYSQPGAGTNGLAEGTNADVPIRLDGANAGESADGLTIRGGGTTVRGVVISRFTDDGIQLETGGGNAISGVYIGTDPDGTTGLGNGSEGIRVSRSPGNTIGGTAVGARNVISGNGSNGVLISGEAATGNVLSLSYIGTTPAGTAALPNADDGVDIQGPNTTVGGIGGIGNLISGNGGHGVSISGASGAIVRGNNIGTNASGMAGVGNVDGGIALLDASTTTIGGTDQGARNVISGNADDGIRIVGVDAVNNLVEGNWIGTDSTGTGRLANAGDGLAIVGAVSNVAELNVISGNLYGVRITGNGAPGNLLEGNLIGLNADGDAAVSNAFTGVRVTDASANTLLFNVISGNGAHGVELTGTSTGNSLLGNRIGTNSVGNAAEGNAAAGVAVSAPANTIGGTDANDRNVISGNSQAGVALIGAEATGNVVEGNFIGTDPAGSSALPNDIGVSVSGPANTIGGTSANGGNVISGNTSAGVFISGSGATGNVVEGNRIGTDASGETALPNGTSGVHVMAATNTIGGTVVGARNVISGNETFGIQIAGAGAADNEVLGNFIGTDVDGLEAVGNGDSGVSVTAPGNIIGGTVAGARNVISGNADAGVDVGGADATGNEVVGNFIGTDAAGTAALGNGNGVVVAGDNAVRENVVSGNIGAGVALRGTDSVVQDNLIGTQPDGTTALANAGPGVDIGADAADNVIGGVVAGEGNRIAFNTRQGVVVGPQAGIGNAIRGNAIFANGALGIDLGADGVTENDDLLDSDPLLSSAANDLQNFPVLTSARLTDSTTIEGKLNTEPLTDVDLDFYVSADCDSSAHGEGERYVGSTAVTTSATGDAEFSVTFPDDLPGGEHVTGTATNPDGSTSEFSACIPVVVTDIQFSASAYADPEDAGSSTITVIRAGRTDESSDVEYATSAGTATPGSDYTESSGTLMFAAGETSKTFTVPIADDALDEDDETINLTLSEPTGATLGTPSTAILTIEDNDEAPAQTPGPGGTPGPGETPGPSAGATSPPGATAGPTHTGRPGSPTPTARGGRIPNTSHDLIEWEPGIVIALGLLVASLGALGVSIASQRRRLQRR